MNASTVLSPAMQRVSTLMIGVFQKFLMVAGLVFIAGLIGVQSGRIDLDGPLVQKLLLVDTESVAVDADPADVDEPAVETLPPRLRGAMDYVTRRYKVSTEALQPVFETAHSVGRELHIDPLLIIAVIGVESGFNPFSQSGYGAQGLMQVVPRFHQDKLPEESASFLDPVVNVPGRGAGAQGVHSPERRTGGRSAAVWRCHRRPWPTLLGQGSGRASASGAGGTTSAGCLTRWGRVGELARLARSPSGIATITR